MSDSATPPYVPLNPATDGWEECDDGALDHYYANVEVIGQYKVIRHLGQGGSSDVFLCEQPSPHRQVALKLLKVSQCDARRQRRFQLEIDLLATLEHPGIANIYEAGVADVGRGPQPYYTMESIDGERLDRFMGTEEFQNLPIVDRIKLFLKVADAVRFAHDQGVIHRDLKPGNILVTSTATTKIKVIDFGLARLTDPKTTVAAVTRTGHIVGTPLYMSPEQFKDDGQPADCRSDIYSLGLVLYEMLAGRQPYELDSKRALIEIANTVLAKNPTPLTKVNPLLKGDLEVIVAKALEKDPADRYQSLAAVTEDLELFVAGRPIRTKRPTIWNGVSKWYRRSPRAALSVIITALLLVTTTILATVASVIAYQGQAETQDYAVRLDRSSRYLTDANRELTEFAHVTQLSSANATLMRTALSRDSNPSLTRSLLFDTTLISEAHRHFAWHVIERQSDWVRAEGRWLRGPVLAASFSADGEEVALAASNAIDVRSSRDLTLQWSVPERLEPPTLLALAPNRESVAYRKRDRSIVLYRRLQDDKTVLCDGAIDAGHSIAFSSAGAVAIGLSDGVIRVWDDVEKPPRQFQIADAPMVGLRFSADCKELYTAAANGRVQTIQLADGSITKSTHFETAGMLTARFSHDGRYVTGGRRFHYVRVWDRETDALVYQNRNPGPFIASDVFESPQLRIGLATRSRVELIRPGNKPVFLSLGTTPVRTLCASPDGSVMLVGDDGGNVRLFRTSRPEVPRGVPLARPKAGTVRFIGSSQRLLACSGPGNLDIYDLGRNECVSSLPRQPSLIADAELDQSATTIYYSLTANQVASWDLQRQAAGKVNVKVNQRIVDLVVAPDDSKLFGVSRGGQLWSYDLHQETAHVRSAQHEHDCTAIIAAGAETLFTADAQGVIQRWQTDPLRPVRRCDATGGRVHEIAMSPDNRILAAACGDGNVRIYDAASLRLVKELIVHTSAVRSLDFSPDGIVLATGGLDSQLILWDTEVWQPQGVWDVEGSGIRSTRFSPDGKVLAVCGNHHQITLWEVE